jgi:hypothetical protein
VDRAELDVAGQPAQVGEHVLRRVRLLCLAQQRLAVARERREPEVP